MNIRQTFLKLTQWTYPYGTEGKLRPFLPKGYQEDQFGNYFIKIGESDTMFTCHLDTCSSYYQKVNHVIGSKIIQTDGKTILGADDKAGMTVLLYMIENKIPGLYYFFIGEEVGGVGSSSASELDFSDYKKCVSFDRRGYNSVITQQCYGRCCSDEFAKALSSELNKNNLSFNFSPDPTGIFTDSAYFTRQIPECTNISVGYFNEHSVRETQDILFLMNLCETVLKVDWNNLPISRNINTFNYKTDSFEVDETMSATISVWVEEEKWVAQLHPERISKEKNLIYDWLMRQGGYYGIKEIDWDGKSAYVTYSGVTEYLGERDDLIYLISELGDIPLDELDLIFQLT